MASVRYMLRQIEWAREAYSERNYNRCWNILFSVVVDGDACPSQKELNRIEGLTTDPSTRREGFRQLGTLAAKAVTNIEFANEEHYTREFNA